MITPVASHKQKRAIRKRINRIETYIKRIGSGKLDKRLSESWKYDYSKRCIERMLDDPALTKYEASWMITCLERSYDRISRNIRLLGLLDYDNLADPDLVPYYLGEIWDLIRARIEHLKVKRNDFKDVLSLLRKEDENEV